MDGGRRQGHFQRRGATSRALSVVLLGALSTLLWASPVAAQDGDPYGSTSTTAGSPPPAASCEMDLVSGQPGEPRVATVQNLPPGGEVRLLFGGVDVGGAIGGAGPDGSAARIDFTMPQLAPGVYPVTAAGVGFAVSCHAGSDGVEVLGATVAREPSSSGLGALPRTGLFVALLVAVALALLLVGRALLEASDERRRAEAGVARATGPARS